MRQSSHNPAKRSHVYNASAATGLIAGTACVLEQPLRMSLQVQASNPLTEAACEAAGEAQVLQLPIMVEPSTAPTTIVLMVGDDIMPFAVSVASLGQAEGLGFVVRHTPA